MAFRLAVNVSRSQLPFLAQDSLPAAGQALPGALPPARFHRNVCDLLHVCWPPFRSFLAQSPSQIPAFLARRDCALPVLSDRGRTGSSRAYDAARKCRRRQDLLPQISVTIDTRRGIWYSHFPKNVSEAQQRARGMPQESFAALRMTTPQQHGAGTLQEFHRCYENLADASGYNYDG